IDAAAHRADDELDHVEVLVLVDELDVGEDGLAGHLDVDMVVAVDHDFCHPVVTDQGLDRPQLLVVLVDVDTGDPDCHSASLRTWIYIADRQLYIHARDRDSRYRPRPGHPQRAAAYVQRSSRGGHLVDQQDRFALESAATPFA